MCADNDSNSRYKTHTRWIWLALIAVIFFAAAVRMRLVAVPLERDEGEYAYAGQLILQGVPPYAQVYNMKMPGIYAAYALILAVFGQTHVGIHWALLIINAATILLLFLLVRKLFDPIAALVAAAAFAVLSMSRPVQGIFANAEHFVLLPALAGIVLLVRALDRQKPFSVFAAALLLGIAFLMKQHGVAFIIFAGLYLLFYALGRRPFASRLFLINGLLFCAGVLLPFVVTCLFFWRLGVFEKFWFWTFDYARQYVSTLPFTVGLGELKTKMVAICRISILLWILSGVGLTALLWNKKARQQAPVVIAFVALSFLAICPGFYFRPHYFVLLLPAVSMLSGIAASTISQLISKSNYKRFARAVPLLLVLIALLEPVVRERRFFFKLSPTDACRTTYGLNPFPEAIQIAKLIKEHSTEDDRIAVLGSEPQIFFYADRRSATGHIYTYPLMEPRSYALKMQQDMIREIEAAQPKFLIYVNISTSWLRTRNSIDMIFRWFDRYQLQNYRLVGVIDIIPSEKKTMYSWGQDAREYSAKSEYWIHILQRESP